MKPMYVLRWRHLRSSVSVILIAVAVVWVLVLAAALVSRNGKSDDSKVGPAESAIGVERLCSSPTCFTHRAEATHEAQGTAPADAAVKPVPLTPSP